MGDYERLGSTQIRVLNSVNLDSITTATSGAAVDVGFYKDKSVFINAEVTGDLDVTVNIQASPDGSTWYTLDTIDYASSASTDIFPYSSFFRYLRTTTTDHSSGAVTTTITGRS